MAAIRDSIDRAVSALRSAESRPFKRMVGVGAPGRFSFSTINSLDSTSRVNTVGHRAARRVDGDRVSKIRSREEGRHRAARTRKRVIVTWERMPVEDGRRRGAGNARARPLDGRSGKRKGDARSRSRNAGTRSLAKTGGRMPCPFAHRPGRDPRSTRYASFNEIADVDDPGGSPSVGYGVPSMPRAPSSANAADAAHALMMLRSGPYGKPVMLVAPRSPTTRMSCSR
ncbi:hypothetical protein BX604_5375 [Burkholderia sp. JKS000303]|nr:hypothetical protein BX604_5375 [Burkholderia sp. JKS000303]